MMRIKLPVALCLTLILIGLSACNGKDKNRMNDYSVYINGKSQEEIHNTLGEPSGALFGSRGDVYLLENKTKITIYYDNDGLVKNLLITDKEEAKTIELSDNDSKNESSMEGFSNFIKGISQDEIQRILGESSGLLFGSRGEVYLLENQTKITVYYDDDGMINLLTISDKEETTTFTTE